MSETTSTEATIANQGNREVLGFPVGHLAKRVAELQPAYFALVMATGIVSLACLSFGLTLAAQLLFLINVLAFCTLLVLFAMRACLFNSQFIADWCSHKRAFGFFTLVAATNVLGCQVHQMARNDALTQALWWTGLLLWVASTYTIFVLLVVRSQKPSLEEGINGGWLISVVATQSVCVLGCQVKPLFASADLAALLLISFWLFGGMLYIWLISLILYRYMFFRFEPGDLVPPYWVNMGAMAITTLAGTELLRGFGDTAPIVGMVPFVKGLTVMYWATATWWIPMLLALGVWRHCVRRFRFTYDPLYWGLVFPLGMYSVCTLRLAAVLEITQIVAIARAFLVLGLIAWLVTFLTMAQRPLYAVLLALRSTTFSNSNNLEDERDDVRSTISSCSGTTE